jgi:hypothetical protein
MLISSRGNWGPAAMEGAPPPGKHLGIFGGKKHLVFSPAAAKITLHALKPFFKLGK